MYGRRWEEEGEAQRRTAHLNSFVRPAGGQNVLKREGSRPSHPLRGGGGAGVPVVTRGGLPESFSSQKTSVM